MKQNKKRALFYVLLFVLGVVFGLTKINGQAEDGYLLKADEKGNDDLIYDYPLEKDRGVSEEYSQNKDEASEACLRIAASHSFHSIPEAASRSAQSLYLR